MLKRALLVLLALVFALPCYAEDLQLKGAREYIAFLAGDGEAYSRSNVLRDDYLFLLRRLAYPLSSWAWSQAVVKSERADGDSVVLDVVKPDISSFFSGKRPEIVEEWGGYLSVLRSYPDIGRKEERLVLKVNSLGVLLLSEEAKKKMLENITKDISEGLSWCRKNQSLAPREYIFSMQAEMKYSSVPISASLLSEVEKTIKELEKGDAK